MYGSRDIYTLSQITIVNCYQIAVERCNRDRAFDCEIFNYYSELSKSIANSMQIFTIT